MPANGPFNLAEFIWQEHKCSPNYLYSVGITLLNGASSPMYSNTPQDMLNLQKRFVFTEEHIISTIIVKSQKNTCLISTIEFYDQDGEELCKVKTKQEGEVV